MNTLSDLLTEYIDATSKSSDSTNQARGIRRISAYNQRISAMEDWNFLEKAYTLTSVAGANNYLPLTLRKIKDVTVLSSNILYTPKEVVNEQEWDRMNIYSSITSDVITHFHIRANQILWYPKFATNGNTITLNGLKDISRPMMLLDYSTGTVAVTNASAVVTGTSTSWGVANALPGAFIEINFVGYEILTVDSTTQITLTQPYQGTTGSSLNYRIGDVSFVPDPFSDLCWLGAAVDYYQTKEDSGQKISVLSAYDRLMATLEFSRYNKTTNTVEPRGENYYINPNDYPINLTHI